MLNQSQNDEVEHVRQDVETKPRAPFTDWPVQLHEPSVGFYWYLKPSILVSQSTVVHATEAVIDRHNDIVDRVLARDRRDIQADGGLFMFFAWRSVRSYDSSARARQRERMQARGRTYSRRTVLVIHPANSLLNMAVSAANLFATIVLKSRIEVVTNPDDELAKLGLQPPLPGDRVPGA